MNIPSRISDSWSRAADVPHDVSQRSAERLRKRYPDATPAQLIDIATRRFMRRVGTESAAVGAASVFPGTGSAVGAAASGAQLLAFFSEAAHHTLVVAHLYGIDIRDPQKRRALVLSVVTGRDGAQAISTQLGIHTLSWFRMSFLDIRTSTAAQFNAIMSRWLSKKAATTFASSTAGRLLPFGVGAVVGWTIGRSLAANVVEGIRYALGQPPLTHPHVTRIIEVHPDTEMSATDPPFDTVHLPDTLPERTNNGSPH